MILYAFRNQLPELISQVTLVAHGKMEHVVLVAGGASVPGPAAVDAHGGQAPIPMVLDEHVLATDQSRELRLEMREMFRVLRDDRSLLRGGLLPLSLAPLPCPVPSLHPL